ncbi:hypothetical protein LJR219_004458 [Phenylobacterium sp. LjRoot219]|uniref:hypothetical protein n=1 Tax=Phenylobacterium sp. LjRoot219 TaxID=3342283 RepID=UPI003ED031E3
MAFFLANKTRSLIAGEAAAPSAEQRIRAAVDAAAPEALIVRDMLTLQLGPRTILVVVVFDLRTPFTTAQWRAATAHMTQACLRSDARVSQVSFQPAPA